jgi:hypothetical protein
MNAGGWDICFVHQPVNSPDCNTLELAFLCTIQSLQYFKVPEELPLDICCKVWTAAQIVMNQILIHNGNNNYKLPHIVKLKFEKLATFQ